MCEKYIIWEKQKICFHIKYNIRAIILLDMGSHLSQPVTQIDSFHKNYPGNVLVSAASIQGWRNTMEDCYFVEQLSTNVLVAGICDGHGGVEVAKYAAKHIPRELKNDPNLRLKNYSKALGNVCRRLDHMLQSPRGQEEILNIRKELKLTGKKKNENACWQVGCVVNLALLTSEKIYIMNLGDCRAVLSKEKNTVILSEDHKPNSPVQKARIEKSGGKVINNRINDGLNVSRALGDFALKNNPQKSDDQQLLINIPEINEIWREKQNQFLVIGCDGFWQRYLNNNQALVEKINTMGKKMEGEGKDKDENLLKELLKEMLAPNLEASTGRDNMTVMLLRFPPIY